MLLYILFIHASYIMTDILCVLRYKFIFLLNIKQVLNYLIATETVSDGDILQMIALLKQSPSDLRQHSCTHYSKCVNLNQDYAK